MPACPCGLKASRLSQQIAAATERRKLLCNRKTGYRISIILHMLYIFLLSTVQNTGGLSIIHQSAPEDKVVLWLLYIVIMLTLEHKRNVC